MLGPSVTHSSAPRVHEPERCVELAHRVAGPAPERGGGLALGPILALAALLTIAAGCASGPYDPHVGGPHIAHESAVIANGGYIGGPASH